MHTDFEIVKYSYLEVISNTPAGAVNKEVPLGDRAYEFCNSCIILLNNLYCFVYLHCQTHPVDPGIVRILIFHPQIVTCIEAKFRNGSIFPTEGP